MMVKYIYFYKFSSQDVSVDTTYKGEVVSITVLEDQGVSFHLPTSFDPPGMSGPSDSDAMPSMVLRFI
jgi:hypothetical protein